MKTKDLVTLVITTTFLLATIPDADAGSIRVRCEKRPHRSKISVDGNDLVPGLYRAVVKSKKNRRSSPLQPTIGDEVELDFDSNPGNIAAGATPISKTFVKKSVTAKIIDEAGFTVVSDTVNCRVRKS
ncbi:MAG: hypothetical protein ACREVH_07310 [Gammaproteobacteria bacterium]